MHAGRVLADEQDLPDLAVRAARRDQLQHLALARRQAQARGLGVGTIVLGGRYRIHRGAEVEACPHRQRRDLAQQRLGLERRRDIPRRTERLHRGRPIATGRQARLCLAPPGIRGEIRPRQPIPRVRRCDPGQGVRLPVEPRPLGFARQEPGADARSNAGRCATTAPWRRRNVPSRCSRPRPRPPPRHRPAALGPARPRRRWRGCPARTARRCGPRPCAPPAGSRPRPGPLRRTDVPPTVRARPGWTARARELDVRRAFRARPQRAEPLRRLIEPASKHGESALELAGDVILFMPSGPMWSATDDRALGLFPAPELDEGSRPCRTTGASRRGP